MSLQCLLSDSKTSTVHPFVGVPNREGIFHDRARNFTAHANKLANTAVAVASGGGCNNKRIIEGINHAAQDVGRNQKKCIFVMFDGQHDIEGVPDRIVSVPAEIEIDYCITWSRSNRCI